MLLVLQISTCWDAYANAGHQWVTLGLFGSFLLIHLS